MSNVTSSTNYAGADVNLSGLLRDTFAQLADNRSDIAVIQSMVDFNAVPGAAAPGNVVQMPVVLGFSSGSVAWKFGRASIAAAGTPSRVDWAQIQGANIVTPVEVPFDLATALQDGDSSSASADFAKLLAIAGKATHERELEISLLNGGTGVGVVSSLGSVGGSAGAWSRAVTFTQASWSVGFWAAADGLGFDAYLVSGPTLRNPTDPLTVLDVDFNTFTVTFGSVTSANTEISAIVAGDTFFRRKFFGNECDGLLAYARATSGSVEGISVASSSWKALQYDALSNPLSNAVISKAQSIAIARGLGGEVVALTSTASYADLEADFQSMRRLDSSYSTGKLSNGASKMEFQSRVGRIAVVAHPTMPYGETVIGPLESLSIVGTSKPTMDIAGIPLQQMAANQSTDNRIYSNAAPAVRELSRWVRILNIVPTA